MKMSIVIVVLTAVVAIVVWAWPRVVGQEVKSFWDVVRNPDKMPDLDQYHAEVDRAAKALSGSPDKVAKLVEYYIFDATSSRDAWTELRILDKLGNEAYPHALKILRDPQMFERLSTLADTDEAEPGLPEAPINRLCEIFGQNTPPPPEAAALLSPFLRSSHDEIRQGVALTIGSIASVESLPDLRRAFADEDEYVRSYALMGIGRAIKGNRIEGSGRDEFFTAIADMWPSDTSFNVCDDLPALLLQLDRDRGITFLLDDELFSVQFSPLWRILQTFNAESVDVPRQRILAIINEASKEPIKYPLDNVVEQALPLLARHRNQDDLPMIERFLTHDNADVVRGATEAMYTFHRYSELIRDPREVAETKGWDALTTAEKHICAIETLDAEVNNGGFAQYYFNSYSDHWQDAHNGLAAIGAKSRHRVMSATLDTFGNAKPATDRETRTSQLAKVVRKKEDPFNEQDNAWYDIEDENLDLLLLRYNLRNLEGRRRAESTLDMGL